jgi:hypothetical protein
MPIKVPQPVADYFAAQNAHDIDAMLASFAEGGLVIDEGKDRRGLAAIRDWIEETTSKYRPSVAVLGSVETAAGTTATVRVSGTFPGSPIDITYGFTLKDGKIARLEIH